MKKAPVAKLSLRKLLVAMLAVGPVAFLPAPLLATLPSAGSITVSSGSASLAVAGPQATITSSDRAVLNWGTVAGGLGGTVTAFNIGAGETYNFLVPAGGSVLNKVVAGAGTGGASDGVAAIINGTLSSNGRVFVLANGNINIGDGAAINTTGGLVLSTLAEATDLNYVANGDLTYTGLSQGSITIGGGGLPLPSVLGNLNAWAGSVAVNGANITGNVIVNSIGGGAVNLAGAQPTTITGNLTTNSYNGTISQGASPVSVSGTAALNAGTGAITLTNAVNNFDTVQATSSATVSLADANDIALGASSVGNLNVSAAGNITTSGAVATVSNASLTAGAAGANGSISYGTGSSAGSISAATSNGSISINTVGNVTLGTITAGGTLKGIVVASGGNYTSSPTVTVSPGVGGVAGPALTTVTSSGALSGVTLAAGGANYTSNPSVTITGGGNTPVTSATLTASLVGTGVASVNVVGGATFTVAPNVTFASPPAAAGNVQATGTAVLSPTGTVSVVITNPGVGYTSTPSVTLSGGTINPALVNPVYPALNAILAPTPIDAITVSNAGAGYTGNNPSVTVSALSLGTSSQTLTVSTTTNAATGAITAISQPGLKPLFTGTPTLTITGGGTESSTPASAYAVAGSAVSIASSGAVNSTGAIFGSSVSIASATLTSSNTGSISTNGVVSINATGGDALLPKISAGSATLVATGNLSQLTSTLSGLSTKTVQNLTIRAANATLTNSGNSIGSNRLLVTGGNISLTNGDNNGLNVATTSTTGDLNLKTGGSVVFGTGGGTLSEVITVGGNLTTEVTGQSLTSISITPAGSATAVAAPRVLGDRNQVTVAFTGGGGSGATGVPTFNANGQVTGVQITNGGSGYTTAPTVNISYAAGSNTVTTSAAGVNSAYTSTVSTSTLGSTTITRTGNNITDDDDVSFTVNGALNLATNGGNVVFDTQIGSGRGFGTFGQLNANAAGNAITGNVTVHERTSIGVGNVSANVLTVNSTTGNIIFQPTNIPLAATYTTNITTVSARASSSGATISQTTALTLGGGNSTMNSSAGTILDNSTNSLGGNVSVIGGANNTIVSNNNFTLGTSTSVTGTNRLTVTAVDPLGVTNRNIKILNGASANNATMNATGSISVEGGTFGNVTLSAGSGISQATTFVTVNNTLTVGSTAGAVALGGNTSNSIANLVVNETPGGITVGTTGNLTVRGSTSGAVTANAGVSNNATTAGTYGISLGNLTAGSLTLSAANGTGNNTADGVSGAITQQSGTSLGIYGPISATTFGGNITLANANNNFGRIDLNTGSPASGVITLVERDTAKIGSLNSTGAATITSAFGGVIEDTTLGTVLNVPSLSVTANAGSILLGGTTQTTAATTGTVAAATLNTGGAAAILSSGNLTLAASSANSLTATSGRNLAQSGKLNVFGQSTFSAVGNITLADTANNFGPVSATVTGGASSISIVENNTLNLRKVVMAAGSTGGFSAQSVNGDIVDTGLGGVVPGGRTGAVGTGVVSLTAQNGNVVLDDPTTDIASSGGVTFNAKNVTLSVLGGNGTTPIVLGSAGTTSVASGNLTVTSATGNIGNAGNVTSTGQATFQTGNGTIGLTAAGNQFGSLRFSSAAQGASTVVISQSGNMNVLTGSSAVGGVTLASGGNITITNSGGGVVSFGNTALLSATGSITLPKLVQSVGTITVNAAGSKDLSALSLSGDLGSKAPTNFGAGSYLPPSP